MSFEVDDDWLILKQFDGHDVVKVPTKGLELVRLSSESELIHFYEVKGSEMALQFATREAASLASKKLTFNAWSRDLINVFDEHKEDSEFSLYMGGESSSEDEDVKEVAEVKTTVRSFFRRRHTEHLNTTGLFKKKTSVVKEPTKKSWHSRTHPWLRTLSKMDASDLRKAKSEKTIKKDEKVTPPPLPPRRASSSPPEAFVATIEKMKDEADWATLVDFVPVKIIGKGSFSTVLLVRKERGGTDVGSLYAMKVMDKDQILKEGLKTSLLVEREVLRVVKHPFLVELRYAMHTKDRLYLITDFFPGGSLVDSLNQKALGVTSARFLVAELALGLAHLHANGILHRDVKPANVLLDAAGHAHLADYGLAKIVHGGHNRKQRRRSFAGTLEYMAPELLSKDCLPEDYASDWWALGVVLVETAYGQTPFAAPSPRQLMTNILKGDPKIPSKDLIPVTTFGFLVRDPRNRLSDLTSVQHHPFFAGIPFSSLLTKTIVSPHSPHLISTKDAEPNVVSHIFKDHYTPSSSSAAVERSRSRSSDDPDEDDDGLPPLNPTTMKTDHNDVFRGFSYRWNPR